ncbi:glycosyl transferase [Actibacterium pelagium]|uniref:Glycosyl transferase n=2 Tax=Actibacterium pelagium TaxID=2029103 RepID=A0A917EM33_9RHOB|nr:glycosyltransferase family 39 protein [Actibacterium pelagium]GGE54819.1 glycosyl transferase [Actibacterium pelagium]
MQNAATRPSSPPNWLMLTLAVVLGLTVYRLGFLWFSRMDLFVDEAQYWLWGQELAFGYYSKPPLIGWTIRAVTELAGSDAPFWVRFPVPILHGVTALILGRVAKGLWDARAGFLVAVGYLTLPVVAVGSVQMSTDTVLFPFMALALAGYLRLLQTGGKAYAVLAGFALGIGFLAKYAAFYFLICAGLAALFIPQARLGWRSAGLVLLAFFVAISPNVVWNLLNGLTTVEHTMDNADWVRDPGARAGLNYDNLLTFFASQFAVFGPVLMAALLWQPLRDRRWPFGFFQLFTLPIIALVCVQALLSNAYANWAASAYLAGTLAVLPWLSRRWLIGSFVINAGFCLIIPITTLFADDVKFLERYTGLDEMSDALIDTARAEGLNTIVASERNILSDLYYTGRDSGLTFYSTPPEGRAMNHYAQSYPLPGDLNKEVLLVSRSNEQPDCDGPVAAVATLAPDTGAFRKRSVYLYRLPASCAVVAR